MKIKFKREIYTNGYLADRYSKYSEEVNMIEGVPFINFPFQVEAINSKYKYLSWVLIDHDANQVVNFSWIHWLVANYRITSTTTSIPELIYNSNEEFVRGNNTFSCPLTNITNPLIYLGYGGPTPPDKDHVYTLEVYAHTEKLELSDGFFYNQLLAGLEEAVTETASAKLIARY